MVAFLDLIGSTIIRGGIVLILLRLTLSMQEVLYERTEKAAMERNLSTVTEVLTYDLRQAGYGVTGNTFVTCDTNRVIFTTVVDSSGAADQVEYYLEAMGGTTDPVKYILHRRPSKPTSGPDVAMARGVTRFRLWYYNKQGQETSILSDIGSVFVIISMRSDYSYIYPRYPTASWVGRIFPQNL